MNRIKIAHMADFHLSTNINESDKLKAELENNLIQSLFNIFNMLKLAKVDIVLIAGDLYENSYINSKLLNTIKEIFKNFTGHIFISPGNHDYVSISSPYNEKWPDNVHIFLEEKVNFFELKNLKVRVWGMGFNQTYINDNKIKEIKIKEDDYINLGVFHGQLDSSYNNYHPIFKNDIEFSNLDYLALGHIHKRTEIEKLGNTYYAYSGNPMGRGFDEIGEKGIYIGEVGKNYNTLRFWKVNQSEFHILDIDIKNFELQEGIANQIRDKIYSLFGEKYKNNYYRIFIRGNRLKVEFLDISLIKNYLEDIKYLEIIDKTKIQYDFEKLRKENTLLGIFVDKTLSLDIDDSKKTKILELGLSFIEGEND